MYGVKRVWEYYTGLWKRLTGRKRELFYLFHYTLLFLITFLLAYSPFLQAGKSFILVGDGRNQHYPALVYVGRYLRQIVLHLLQGEISIPLFDLNLAMGSDIIATLNYYGFGNPLYLLAAFFPTHYTEYLYNILVIVRLWLSGLAFLALCKYQQKKFPYALIGALVYVFSGYAVYTAIRHPYFIEPMIQLPLLVIGIDLVIRKKRPFIFIFSVFYTALCGYYFLYMMTIMLGFYALVHFFDLYRERLWKNFLGMAVRVVSTYLLGVGLSAPMFFPAVVGFLTSGRAGQSIKRNYFSYGWNYYKNNLLNLIAPPGEWERLTLAAIILLALFALFAFYAKQYRGLKLLAGISAVFYIFPLGGYIMNGFAYPSQRWTFGLVLLLSYILVEMLPTLLKLNKKQQIFCFVIFLLYSLAVFWKEANRTVYHVVGVAALAGTLLVLYLFGEQSLIKKDGKKFGIIACTCLVLFNVSINALYLFSKSHANYIDSFTTYGTETNRIETLYEYDVIPYLRENEGRIDSSSFVKNAGAIWRVPTMHFFWSTNSRSAIDIWKKTENVGIGIAAHDIQGGDQRTLLSTMLSTKYFFERGNRTQYVPYGYSLQGEIGKDNLIYENKYALPWGYTYDSYITSDEAETMNGLELEEAMIQSVVLEKAPAGIEKQEIEDKIQKVSYEIEETKDVEWDRENIVVNKDNAIMTLKFQMLAGTEGYIRLDGFNISDSGRSEFNVVVKCENVSKGMYATSATYPWYWGRENYLANLGYSEEERTACTITFPRKGTYKLNDIQLFALPMDKYPSWVEALREEPLENIVFETNRIAGTVDLSQNKILCISIPYSRGWSARVDGKKTEIQKGNYMFMVLPLTTGHHDIEFIYCTPGLKAGIAASLFSAGVVIYLVYQEKRKRRVL